MSKTFQELHLAHSDKTMEIFEHEEQMMNKHTITRKDLSLHTDLAFEIADLYAEMMTKLIPEKPKKTGFFRKLFRKN